MKNFVIDLKDEFPFLGENGQNPKLEVYLPYNMVEMKREDMKRPSILLCPGGGYVMCSERESEPVALHFLPLGFNVFTLTYSVSPHRFPTQMLEVAAAMELIYKNADEWNCDTSKIAIMGFSAGGHLAAHYSTMFDCKEVRNIFPDSKAVNASILCYPVITINDKANAHIDSFRNLIGCNDITDEQVKYFSCELNVKKTTPQTFLWHTSVDTCVPVKNSLLYSAALAEKGVPFEMHIYPLGGHGLSTCDVHTNDNLPPELFRDSHWLDNLKQWLVSIGFIPEK